MRLPIKDYEGLYEVSNEGKVFSLVSNKELKPNIVNGYCQVGLHKNGVQINKLVHRLVAEAFLENPNNLPQINHKDENRLNNCVNNLEWCDSKYNNNYGNHGQNLSQVLKGRKVEWRERPVSQYSKDGKYIATYKSLIDAERNTGVKYKSIQQVAAGYPNRKSAGGFVWRYADE